MSSNHTKHLDALKLPALKVKVQPPVGAIKQNLELQDMRSFYHPEVINLNNLNISFKHIRTHFRSPRILERTLPIRNATTCNNLFHYYDESKMFCAGPVETLGQPECIGDSGAPFVMMEDDRPVLAGITSWGYGCQKGRPLGIHTKIGNIVSWIVNKAIDMGADMDSARRRNHAKPNIQLRFTNNSNSTKSVKKTQKQRRKRIKQRKNVKDQIRKQNLERKFRLKMIHRGQHVETKKLKKFLKSNVKRDGRHQKTYLKSNQIKKLRTVNSAMPGKWFIM